MEREAAAAGQEDEAMQREVEAMQREVEVVGREVEAVFADFKAVKGGGWDYFCTFARAVTQETASLPRRRPIHLETRYAKP